MNKSEAEQMLFVLETDYVKGQQSLEQRNRLVLEMLDMGFRQADVYRLLNSARVASGGKTIGRDAVWMLVQRGRRATSAK